MFDRARIPSSSVVHRAVIVSRSVHQNDPKHGQPARCRDMRRQKKRRIDTAALAAGCVPRSISYPSDRVATGKAIQIRTRRGRPRFLAQKPNARALCSSRPPRTLHQTLNMERNESADDRMMVMNGGSLVEAGCSCSRDGRTLCQEGERHHGR